ncbi:Cyclic nucleotide-binding domain-containing protein [Lentzea xinjiangensis]|uniref:histidine kinase n=1 Tax=Lentzea xinjiangensis TaxID=402600 RepID=A0A1H9WIF4_9PSEU|nr:ATP-binding protein [Lentzea xinjiangensis]SES33611.1 Cyclic nucleotide-binding domain-containing protein [Lentzea xinjiangensis]
MRRLTAAELRELFLFEKLDQEQLDWLAEHGHVETREADTAVLTEGEPATCFFVLLEGTVALCRNIGGRRVEVSRSSLRGSYFGATQAYLELDQPTYRMTVESITATSMLQFDADEFGPMVRAWFPMAMHLLEGLFWGMHNTQAAVGQHERLTALGALSAGLTHELNNPAAAAVRATATLRERVAGMRHKLSLLAQGTIDPAVLPALVELQEKAVDRVARAPKLSPLETSDAEDDVAGWLDDHGVEGGWDVAPVLVAAGLDVEWLESSLASCPGAVTGPAVHWLRYSVETEMLMDEIEDAVTRVSGLVGAAKQYSQMDRAPFQVVDVHELLDSTLVMLGGKLADVRVVRDYDRMLPGIPAYAGELNQVWMNMIDNALAAMGGSGTLTVRTSRQDKHLVVEIGDTGHGIPAEVRSRIFEPFFTTKPVGEGTGLGLEISWRIVVNKHHGAIRVESMPGDTRFQVFLPLEPAGP